MKIVKRMEVAMFVRPPGWFRLLSTHTVWRIPTTDKVLFLTFDDGPVPDNTEWILSELKNQQAHATFFCVGENVKAYPQLYRKILDEGHAVGNHTFSHLNGFQTPTRRYVRDVSQAARLIGSKLFRPPYGRIKPIATRVLSARYYVVLWDVLSMDYDAGLTPGEVMDNVMSSARPGSIIVFHDSIKARRNLEEVLPRVLETYTRQGFKFVPLSDYLS